MFEATQGIPPYDNMYVIIACFLYVICMSLTG